MNKITTRLIPQRLLPDENDQFIIHKPYGRIFRPDKPDVMEWTPTTLNGIEVPK